MLEIVVGRWTFSDQNCRLSEQLWFWLDKMSKQIEYDFRALYVRTIPYILYVHICDWILETDRNVTLGQLHFLGPANSHTHTLSIHCCNTRLSCLVCFSRADFADHVKPRLRQWDPWRALDGRYGSDIHPCVSETSHRPSRLVKAYDWHFLDS